MVFGQPLTVPSNTRMMAITHLVLVVTTGGMSLWLVFIRIAAPRRHLAITFLIRSSAYYSLI